MKLFTAAALHAVPHPHLLTLSCSTASNSPAVRPPEGHHLRFGQRQALVKEAGEVDVHHIPAGAIHLRCGGQPMRRGGGSGLSAACGA